MTIFLKCKSEEGSHQRRKVPAHRGKICCGRHGGSEADRQDRLQSEEQTCECKCHYFIFRYVHAHIFRNDLVASDRIRVRSYLCVFQNERAQQVSKHSQDQVCRIISKSTEINIKNNVLSVCRINAECLIDQRQGNGNDQGRNVQLDVNQSINQSDQRAAQNRCNDQSRIAKADARIAGND